jgi:hypothetical protein
VPELTDSENEATRRDYAERIIAGEFKSIVVVMINNDECMEYWHDGSRIASIGLLEAAKAQILHNHITDGE